MALIQSGWATRQRNTPTSGCAGSEVAQLFEYVFKGGVALAPGDIIELAVLPAYNSISKAYLIGDNATLAGDIGLMSGEVGEVNPARTVGVELFAATAATAAAAKQTLATTALTIAPTDKDRAIGFKVTTGATPTAGQKVALLLKYRAA